MSLKIEYGKFKKKKDIRLIKNMIMLEEKELTCAHFLPIQKKIFNLQN